MEIQAKDETGTNQELIYVFMGACITSLGINIVLIIVDDLSDADCPA